VSSKWNLGFTELKPVFVVYQADKVVQLYETMMTRHTVMVVGPTGGGKSVIINTLAQAQTKSVSQHCVPYSRAYFKKNLVLHNEEFSLEGTMARADSEPITGVWGRSPQRGPGAEPMVRGSEGEAP